MSKVISAPYTVEGQNGIKATVLAKSRSAITGDVMKTTVIEYPRFILAEVNTHRMLGKNSASSRAIPITAMHAQLNAEPVFWGKNQPGMQAKEELCGDAFIHAKLLWDEAKQNAINTSKAMNEVGLHKQIANRVTEPWMMMKTVISGTEWANLYHLRDHNDAQPEFAELAKVTRLADNAVTATLLYPGEWHLPYIRCERDFSGTMRYYVDNQELSVDEALMVSASCCAQVSYRKEDYSLEKAEKIFNQLINSQPCHASPVEHQATPMDKRTWLEKLTLQKFTQDGITHVDRGGNRWSGNLRGWIQHRKLIPGEAVW